MAIKQSGITKTIQKNKGPTKDTRPVKALQGFKGKKKSKARKLT